VCVCFFIYIKFNSYFTKRDLIFFSFFDKQKEKMLRSIFCAMLPDQNQVVLNNNNDNKFEIFVTLSLDSSLKISDILDQISKEESALFEIVNTKFFRTHRCVLALVNNMQIIPHLSRGVNMEEKIKSVEIIRTSNHTRSIRLIPSGEWIVKRRMELVNELQGQIFSKESSIYDPYIELGEISVDKDSLFDYSSDWGDIKVTLNKKFCDLNVEYENEQGFAIRDLKKENV
jgi:hypothetical protein